jgi:hypothetical protein
MTVASSIETITMNMKEGSKTYWGKVITLKETSEKLCSSI